MNAFFETEEVQLLSAMFLPEEIRISDHSSQQSASTTIGEICLDLAPNTAFQDSSQFVKCNLSFTIPAEYPREQPIIRIQKAKGLDDAKLEELNGRLQKKAQELKGQPCLFELVECAREWLTENNVPKTECIICLILFEEADAESFMKTQCWHFFHRKCLADWYCQCQQTIRKKMEDDDRNRVTVPAAKSPRAYLPWCPVCREELQPADISLISAFLPAPATSSAPASDPVAPSFMNAPLTFTLNYEDDSSNADEANARPSAADESHPPPSPVTDDREPNSPPPRETVVRVENFARGTPMRLLRNLFVPFGAKKCRLEHNNRGKALGLVHVFFEDREKALKAAQALNGTLLNENILSCTVLDCISDVPS